MIEDAPWVAIVRLLCIALGTLLFAMEDTKSDHRVGEMRPWPTLVAVELIAVGVFGL